MKSNFELVKEFMITFGQECKSSPTFPNEKIIALRESLIDEEFTEYQQAIMDRDIVDVADALTDMLYVIYGAGASFGIDLDACFKEVHASNMSKLDDDGKVLYREDGKIMKSSRYFEPDLTKIVK
jgi:predicted HAD superfamily Cof-like phosphohydrolase